MGGASADRPKALQMPEVCPAPSLIRALLQMAAQAGRAASALLYTADISCLTDGRASRPGSKGGPGSWPTLLCGAAGSGPCRNMLHLASWLQGYSCSCYLPVQEGAMTGCL